jgi:hypothetical protein
VERPVVKSRLFTGVAGFVSGDGGFGIRLGKKRVIFTYITQHTRDLELMESFKTFFNCGNISEKNYK